MDPSTQGHLIAALRDAQVLDLIEKMDPVDRVCLLAELSAKLAKDVLEGLSPEERGLTLILLGIMLGIIALFPVSAFFDSR
jgi:magnesium transporter